MDFFAKSFAAFVFMAVGLAQAVEEPKLPPTTALASQGAAKLTLADIDAFVEQRISVKDRPGFFNSPKRIEDIILSQLVQKQLAAEARELKLDKDPLIEKQIAVVTDEVLARARMAMFRREMKIPEFTTLAEEEYTAHKEKYAEPDIFDVKHVLVSTKSRSAEEARKIADDVLQQAKDQAVQFDALVDKYSDDPSKSDNGGLMEDAGSNRYEKTFAEAARKLAKEGDLSSVIKTRYGYHVLKLIKRTAGKQKSFAEVKDQIIKQLHDDYIDKQVRGHTDNLRGNKLDANPDAVASLRTRYLPAGMELPQETVEDPVPAAEDQKTTSE